MNQTWSWVFSPQIGLLLVGACPPHVQALLGLSAGRQVGDGGHWASLLLGRQETGELGQPAVWVGQLQSKLAASCHKNGAPVFPQGLQGLGGASFHLLEPIQSE